MQVEIVDKIDQEGESMDLLPTPAKRAKFSSEEETATGMKSFFMLYNFACVNLNIMQLL